ncbi:MAG: sulfurtransferase [Pseudomonadota bacterium]
MTHDPLVDADWLRTHLDEPDLRVADATWFAPWASHDLTARQAYEKAHIPGAVFFDIDDIADTESPLPHMFPSSAKFSSRLSKLGLGDGHRIVLYDRNNFFASARAWWMFRAIGHEDVYVLNGGWAAWEAVGGDVEDLPPLNIHRHNTPRIQADLIKSANQVAEAIERGALVLDARPSARFEGAAPEPREDLASGHIAGSLNLPADSLVNADGFMKPVAELQKLFSELGKPLKGDMVAMCGSGVSAAIVLLALARLGHWRAALYDGSWTDWALSGRPVATGPAA